jgi:hypothetical protein
MTRLLLNSVANIKLLNSTDSTGDQLGVGKTKLYDLINKGLLVAVKQGSRTYITGASILAYAESLQAIGRQVAEADRRGTIGGNGPAGGPQDLARLGLSPQDASV